MLIFSFADIHDAYNKFKNIFVRVMEEHGPPDLVTIAGDFGEKETTIKKIADLLEDFHVKGIAVYGNHESEYLRKIFREEKREFLQVGPLTILNFGTIFEYHGFKFLAISGNRGGGRRWTHWQDESIRNLKNKVKSIDVILSHEMPYGYADWCGYPRTHCGQRSLRLLIHDLNPLLFIGGHLHEFPRSVRAKNGTIVVLSGPINYKNIDYLSSFSIIEITNPSVITFQYNFDHRRGQAILVRTKKYRIKTYETSD